MYAMAAWSYSQKWDKVSNNFVVSVHKKNS